MSGMLIFIITYIALAIVWQVIVVSVILAIVFRRKRTVWITMTVVAGSLFLIYSVAGTFMLKYMNDNMYEITSQIEEFFGYGYDYEDYYDYYYDQYSSRYNSSYDEYDYSFEYEEESYEKYSESYDDYEYSYSSSPKTEYKYEEPSVDREYIQYFGGRTYIYNDGQSETVYYYNSFLWRGMWYGDVATKYASGFKRYNSKVVAYFRDTRSGTEVVKEVAQCTLENGEIVLVIDDVVFNANDGSSTIMDYYYGLHPEERPGYQSLESSMN